MFQPFNVLKYQISMQFGILDSRVSTVRSPPRADVLPVFVWKVRRSLNSLQLPRDQQPSDQRGAPEWFLQIPPEVWIRSRAKHECQIKPGIALRTLSPKVLSRCSSHKPYLRLMSKFLRSSTSSDIDIRVKPSSPSDPACSASHSLR